MEEKAPIKNFFMSAFSSSSIDACIHASAWRLRLVKSSSTDL